MSNFDVTIVGLGWLGLPLYNHLSAKGYRVSGSKTEEGNAELLRSVGVNAFHLKLLPMAVGADLDYWLNCKILVINIPPTRKDEKRIEIYPQQIKNLVKLVNVDTKVLFVSSTSVFGDSMDEVDDFTPCNPTTNAAKALVFCEEWLTNNFTNCNIVRFAGLYGPERHPGRFFAGKKEIPNGDAPVNFIHQQDAVRVIEKLIEYNGQGLRVNACAPEHPSKKEYYPKAAMRGGYDSPTFLKGGDHLKKVKCTWLTSQNFQFEKGVYSF